MRAGFPCRDAGPAGDLVASGGAGCQAETPAEEVRVLSRRLSALDDETDSLLLPFLSEGMVLVVERLLGAVDRCERCCAQQGEGALPS